MTGKPFYIAAEGGFDTFCPQLGCLCGVFMPSCAIVCPGAFKWQYGLIDLIVYLSEFEGINLMPHLFYGFAEAVVLNYLANPVWCDVVMDLHSEGIIGFFAVIARQIPNRSGNPFCIFCQVFVQIKAAVETVGIIHYFLKDEKSRHTFYVDVVFPCC